MSVKQNKFVTTLKEEHHSRTLKRRRTLESDEAWDSQTAKMKNGILASVSVNPTFRVFFLDQAWGHMSKSYVLYWEWVSCNLLKSMEFDLCWKYLVLSFSLLHLHYACLQLKECMHSSTCVMFYIKLFQENPYYPVKGHQNFQWQNCKKITPSNPNWSKF